MGLPLSENRALRKIPEMVSGLTSMRSCSACVLHQKQKEWARSTPPCRAQNSQHSPCKLLSQTATISKSNSYKTSKAHSSITTMRNKRHDGSVGIVTSCEALVRVPELLDFILPRASRPKVGPSQSGALSPGVNWQGQEANTSV
jgi:hypothetical protein